MHADILNRIDHIVVLMMENRSFDNMLGWLYDPLNLPPFDRVPRDQEFDGVSGRLLLNPIPETAPGSEYGAVPVGRAATLDTPPVNPGETYPHVNTQLFGTIIPPGNRPPYQPPYNLPDPLPDHYPMNGFIRDYIEILTEHQQPAGYANYKPIMDCFTPDLVPVISNLARSYAVCDHWFCAVPTQTFPNRSFFHAGTSSGFVINEPYQKWLENDADTIFNLIEDRGGPGLTWGVYYDQADVFPLTLLIHLPKLIQYRKSNFFPMEQFYQDALTGRLPSYTFIQPRFWVDNNDEHPPGSVYPGEMLINNVYQALRNGRNWDRTLFVLTYDEHGGCYDHVQPPRAVCPARGCPRGEQDFRFNRSGLRVPTVLVSPYIEAGTVFRATDWITGREIPLDHTSILKTVTNRFGFPSLTRRDRAAADISQALTLSKPRIDYPLITPLPYHSNYAAGQPLTDLKKGIIELVAAWLSIEIPVLASVEEAVAFLERVSRILD